jgi:hypothetical protein
MTSILCCLQKEKNILDIKACWKIPTVKYEEKERKKQN